MLLRIVDKQQSEEQKGILIEYDLPGCKGQISFDQERSLSKEAYQTSCDWYYSEYPCGIYDQDQFKLFQKNLFQMGRELGKRLYSVFESEGKLLELKKAIESGDLDVEIRSTRSEFAAQDWEALLLPDSEVALSTAARSFVRQFVGENINTERPQFRYELQTATAADKPSQEPPLSATDMGDVAPASRSDSLRVLYVVSRPRDTEFVFSQSNLFRISQNCINRGHNVEFECLWNPSLEKMQDRLSDTDKPFHILGFDGPVNVHTESVGLLFDDSNSDLSTLGIVQLAKGMKACEAALLFLDARAYYQNERCVSAANGLAIVAQTAQIHGLANVLGLDQYTDPWSSAMCFENVLSKLCCGYSLEQAVSLARQALRQENLGSPVCLEQSGFTRWPLLTHYGIQSLTFYDSVIAEPEDPQGLANQVVSKNMYGFQSEMLPPLLETTSDGDVYQLAKQLADNRTANANKLLFVSGSSGNGKSHLLHVLCYHLLGNEDVDYAFYFDYHEAQYTRQDILQMIAPVFEISTDDWESVESLVSKKACAFVLDNVPASNTCENALSKSVHSFLKKQLAAGNFVLVSGERQVKWQDVDCTNHAVESLPLIEQKLLSARVLSHHELDAEFNQKAWLDLLTACRGVPWISKTVSRLLVKNQAEILVKALEDHVFVREEDNAVDRFYAWQWSTLSPVWQQFLVLSHKTPGLILEMFMVAGGQNNSFEPAKRLYEALGDSDLNLSEVLDGLDSQGFLKRFPHGRFIDKRCKRFLKARALEPDFDHLNKKPVRLLYGQVICEGVRILSQHVLKQPNPSISNNLLFNRRAWAEHLEELWFSFEFESFESCKQSLDQLLNQAGLAADSAAWSLDLVERSELVVNSSEDSMERMLAWFRLVNHAMKCDKFRSSEKISDYAVDWRAWFNNLEEEPHPHEVLLLQHAMFFLERVYRSRERHQDCIEVCLNAYLVFSRHELWQPIVHALGTAARSCVSIGDSSKALYYEDKLLAEVPFGEAPWEFKVKEYVGIISSRLARSEAQGVQRLLDELRASEKSNAGAERMGEVIESMQNDLYFIEQEYSKALPYFSRNWARAIQAQQVGVVDGLKNRLIEVENAIGREHFDAIFEQEVPIGTTKPREYVATYH